MSTNVNSNASPNAIQTNLEGSSPNTVSNDGANSNGAATNSIILESDAMAKQTLATTRKAWIPSLLPAVLASCVAGQNLSQDGTITVADGFGIIAAGLTVYVGATIGTYYLPNRNSK